MTGTGQPIENRHPYVTTQNGKLHGGNVCLLIGDTGCDVLRDAKGAPKSLPMTVQCGIKMKPLLRFSSKKFAGLGKGKAFALSTRLRHWEATRAMRVQASLEQLMAESYFAIKSHI